MIKYAFLTGFALMISLAVFSQNETTKSSNSKIDIFKLKYKGVINSEKRNVKENIYVGFLDSKKEIGNIKHQQLVFGESRKSVIAYTYENDSTLNYCNLKSTESLKKDSTLKPWGVLFFFNKKPNDKWNVSIDSSYFWKKEIVFEGVEIERKDSIFVYRIQDQVGYSDIGNRITKIFYSKKNGFVRFILHTHWFPVEVNKIH